MGVDKNTYLVVKGGNLKIMNTVPQISRFLNLATHEIEGVISGQFARSRKTVLFQVKNSNQAVSKVNCHDIYNSDCLQFPKNHALTLSRLKN